jgi:xanthine dehydrogenase accessory factor
MKEMFEKMKFALMSGEDAVLCSIIASHGSAPRGKGAKMAVFSDGSTCGTIGGGAVERISAEMAGEVLRSGASITHPFHLAPSQINDIGMICGGDVTVYFRFFDHRNDLPLLSGILAALSGGENAWLVMQMMQGSVSCMGLYDETNGLQFMQSMPQETLLSALQSRAVLLSGTPSYYVEPISRKGNVYIFGGGHVSQETAPLLAHIGFSVVVYDSRPEFAKLENFPGAKDVLCGSFENIFAQVTITASDYVVIMTPGHQADFEVLRQTLPTDAPYVGCIGSRLKVAKTKERLAQAGLSEAQINRMVSPIGLSIHAETPAEIAVSIAAQLIAFRAVQTGAHSHGDAPQKAPAEQIG